MTEKKNVIMDATLLSSLMNCERKLELRHGLNIVPIGPKSKALEMGSLMHVFLEWYYKEIRDGRRSTARQVALEKGEFYYTFGELITPEERTEEVLDADGNIVSPAIITQEAVYEPLSNMQIEDYALCIDTFNLYCERWKNDSFTPVHIEHVIGKILYEDEELRVLWKAKFDLISDTPIGFIPTDHKTMKQRRETLALNNQFMGQCHLLGVRSVLINKVGFQTSLKPEERFHRVSISYTADQLAEWVSETVYWAKYLINLNETNYFPRRFTQCESKFGKCEYYENLCSVNQSMRDEQVKLFFKPGKHWDVNNDD